jgi:PAS domain S-box-containing protein
MGKQPTTTLRRTEDSVDLTPTHLDTAILTWTREFAPHGILTTDRNLRITSWNHWLETHSSFRAEQVSQRQLFDIVPSLTERNLDRYFLEALKGEPKVLSRALHGYLIPLPPSVSGTGFDHMQQSSRIAPLLLDGSICGTITIIEDVTEREWQNGILRANEERFRVMADTVPNIIYTATPDGMVEFLNQRFYDASGLPQNGGLGLGWMHSVHPEDLGKVKERWQHSLQTGDPFHAEFRLRHLKGSSRWFISRAWPIYDTNRKIARWFGAATDIHDLKEMQLTLSITQTQLQEHTAKLEQIVDERTTKLRETISQLESFSYTVAHDIRAPIRALEGYADLLLNEFSQNLNPQATRLLKNMARAAQHLDALTRDLLNYTKVSTQPVELHPLDVEGIIENVTAINPSLDEHGRITVVRPLHQVMGHPTLLGQCFSNLLENAVKFVAPNVSPRVVIRSERQENMVRLWVEDNGIGMDTETQKKIFGIFQRARSARTYPGTGIGLAIVVKAVERMGGGCGVESEPGKGSRFWLRLRPVDTSRGGDEPENRILTAP